MDRASVLETLRKERQHLREQFGVDSIALFGSVARQEPRPDSDVDVLVGFCRPITLFDLVAIQQYLERRLDGRRVDVVPRDSIYPAFRDTILAGAIDVA
jgi:predicted nucleotidyltransferase